jgi:4'-phosphopantetheinyl transferase
MPWPIDSSPEAMESMEAMVRAIQPQDPPLLLCIDRREQTSEQTQERLAATLTAQEWGRFNGYHRPADRERFLLGRGCLRQWLGWWQNRAPDAVELALGAHGKPHSPGGPEFNLSHSGDLILVALHPCQPVGVDVEQLRPDLNWEPIARRMFAADRVRELLQCPAAEQPLAFLQHWCQLEATHKATGVGLAGASLLNPGEAPTRQPAQNPYETGCRHWSLDLPDGYRGCTVVVAPPPA